MKIVHLPSYDNNPYQENLIAEQKILGHEALAGGGGGYFLRTALFKWKPDIMHFHWIHPYLLRESTLGTIVRSLRFIIEVLILRLWGITITWTIHNLHNHENKHIRLERFFSSIFLRLCQRAYTHTGEAAKLASGWYKCRVSRFTVIPHPSYIGLVPEIADRQRSRESLQIAGDTTCLLFFGRINPYKGVFDLIDALEKVGKETVLIIAGRPDSPTMEARLKTRAESNARILLKLGTVPESELPTLFAAADVVVFPYKNILTSGAILMAMSYGKYVIAPDIASIKETLPPEGVTYFIPSYVDSLASALKAVLVLDTTAGGQANYREAEKWRIDKISEMLIDSYKG